MAHRPRGTASVKVDLQERLIPESVAKEMVGVAKLEAAIGNIGKGVDRIESNQAKQDLRLQKVEVEITTGTGRRSVWQMLLGTAVTILAAIIATGVWLK